MDRVKEDILSFMAESRADAGHSLAARQFYSQRVQRYTPPEQDSVVPALQSLVADGYLEEREGNYFLTENGLSRIYPGGEVQAIAEVRADVLDFLRSNNARVGHTLAVRPFFVQYANRYNPLQMRAFEKAAAALTQDNILEERDGGHILTQIGYNQIYTA